MSRSEIDPQKLERARTAFASVAYAKFLGLRLGEVANGEVTVYLDVRDELKQNRGVVHGGAIASLIDTASAFAVLTQIDLDKKVTTSDLTIHYLRPVMTGRMTANAHIIRGGRRLFVLAVDVFDESQAMVATAVTTYITVDPNTPKNSAIS
ncbi:MAG TPA: PaaI family thioesterase [Pyrinomonadaceae bacterium]|nr:PaaI family thioesterase [Pyrinomonadaceae bacterium]